MRILPALAVLQLALGAVAPGARAQAPRGPALQAYLTGKTFKFQQKGWDRSHWWEIRFAAGGRATSRPVELETPLALRWSVRGSLLCLVTLRSGRRTCHRVVGFRPDVVVLQNVEKPAERTRLVRVLDTAPAGGQTLSGKRLHDFVMGRTFRYEVREDQWAQLWFATPDRMRTRVENHVDPDKFSETWFGWRVEGPLLCLTGGGATNCFRLTPRVRRVKGRRVTEAVAVFTQDNSRYLWRRCLQTGASVPIACAVLH